MSNAEQLITEHIDVWTSAIKRRNSQGRGSSKKIELYGIKKLRELILELAVRGLLVPQDPNEEPASELLKKISAEKARLQKEGEIKKQKPLPPISNEEKPFQIPVGWEFKRLGDITEYLSQGVNTAADKVVYTHQGYKILQSKHITSGRLDDGDARFVSDVDYLQYKARFSPRINDILFTNIGTIGKSIIIKESIDFLVAWNLFIVRPVDILFSEFIKCVFDALDGNRYFDSLTSGSATKFVSKVLMSNIVIAIPPLSEQHRIVAKVDQLMVLCDQLEQQTETSLTAHQALVEALLSALTSAANAEAFNQAWQRIAEHFDTLFTTEHSIDQLKQTILQLAVMGKLVPQNPNDEPASELLKKIAAEKAKLVKEGKIKKQKPLPPISDEEKPFDLPTGWDWCRLGNSGVGSTGKTPSTKEWSYFDGDIPFIGPGQITPAGALLSPEKFLSEQGLLNSTEANPGDILMVCIGGSIGKGVICNKRIAFNQQINAITPLLLDSNFLYISVSTDLFYQSILNNSTGSATPIINRSKWEKLLIPVCPLKEQHRIVAKIDELMTICDQVQSRLSEAQTTQLQLADAMAEQALN